MGGFRLEASPWGGPGRPGAPFPHSASRQELVAGWVGPCRSPPASSCCAAGLQVRHLRRPAHWPDRRGGAEPGRAAANHQERESHWPCCLACPAPCSLPSCLLAQRSYVTYPPSDVTDEKIQEVSGGGGGGGDRQAAAIASCAKGLAIVWADPPTFACLLHAAAPSQGARPQVLRCRSACSDPRRYCSGGGG